MTNLRAAAEQALEALKYMHDEKCDYMRRNNLGDPLREDAARLALPAIEALETALAQAEPVQFDPAEALRLAEEFAQMKQAHGYFCNADSRRLMEEAHSALAAYLGIKGGGNG